MGYTEWYERISAPFRGAMARKAVGILDRFLVVAIALAYLGLGCALAASGDPRIGKYLLVPAATFGIVTALRAVLDRPRPYELYPIEPLIVKETTGKSLPSRHLASAVVIAIALAWIDARFGLPALIACAIVAATRIVGGVHFPRDIAAAAAISLACGLAGFLLIP